MVLKEDDEKVCDKDDRTIFVRGFNERITEKLLTELFLQAGPVERVAIPKDSDGNLKTFGFVTYKHIASVNYAMNIFAGTRLFGREIAMKNRKSDQQQLNFNAQSHPSASLLQLHGYNNNPAAYLNPLANDPSPLIQNQQQLIQQHLLMMATGQNLQNSLNSGAQIFTGNSLLDQYTSARGDSPGSHREHYVDRHRHHREDNRSSRSNPYRRTRSRSPNQRQDFRTRERSPKQQGKRLNDRGRKGDRSNYHRWGKR